MDGFLWWLLFFTCSHESQFRATITARHGQIQHAEISGINGNSLQDRDLHQILDWREHLKLAGTPAFEEIGKWFNHLFGVGRL